MTCMEGWAGDEVNISCLPGMICAKCGGTLLIGAINFHEIFAAFAAFVTAFGMGVAYEMRLINGRSLVGFFAC